MRCLLALMLMVLLISSTAAAQATNGLQPVNPSAPCVLPVPPEAQVVSTSRTLDATFTNKTGTYWICAGASMEVERGNNTYFVESYGRLSVSGGKHRVYLKAGATLTMSWGAEVSVLKDPSAPIKNESITSKPEVTACPGLSFNYLDAPATGCPGTRREPPPPPQPVFDTPPPADPAPGDPFAGPQSSYQAMLIPIGSSALVVGQPRRYNLSGRHLWVCGSSQLYLVGDNNVVFLEPGAELTFSGNNNLVYSRGGGKVRFTSGANNLVLAEQGSDVQQNNWGGNNRWDWGFGWYGPQGQRRSMNRQGASPNATPSSTQKAIARGTNDKQNPTDEQPPPPTEPSNPLPTGPSYQPPVGAIGPPYGQAPRLRLEWLEYLEFDYRSIPPAMRCR
jgi:hypothetical protein